MINMENKLMTEVATRRPNRSTSDKDRRTTMRAMRAGQFSGYEGLKLVDIPKPEVSDGKVLLRMTAAGVAPLDHTILSGQFPLATTPLVLGNEGAGVVEAAGGTELSARFCMAVPGPCGGFAGGL